MLVFICRVQIESMAKYRNKTFYFEQYLYDANFINELTNLVSYLVRNPRMKVNPDVVAYDGAFLLIFPSSSCNGLTYPSKTF